MWDPVPSVTEWALCRPESCSALLGDMLHRWGERKEEGTGIPQSNAPLWDVVQIHLMALCKFLKADGKGWKGRVQRWTQAKAQQVGTVIVQGGVAMTGGGRIKWKQAAPFGLVANFQLCEGAAVRNQHAIQSNGLEMWSLLIYISLSKGLPKINYFNLYIAQACTDSSFFWSMFLNSRHTKPLARSPQCKKEREGERKRV